MSPVRQGLSRRAGATLRGAALAGIVVWVVTATSVGSWWVAVPVGVLMGVIGMTGALRHAPAPRPRPVDVTTISGTMPSLLVVLVVERSHRQARAALAAAGRLGARRLVVLDRDGRAELLAAASRAGVPVLTSSEPDGAVVRQLVASAPEDLVLVLRADVVVVAERVRTALGAMAGVDALVGTIARPDDPGAPTMDYGPAGAPGEQPGWDDASSFLAVRRHVFTVLRHRRLPASCWTGPGLVRVAERLGGVVARPSHPIAVRPDVVSEGAALRRRAATGAAALVAARRVGLRDLGRVTGASGAAADALEVAAAPLRAAVVLLPGAVALTGATPVRTASIGGASVGLGLVALWAAGAALDGRGWTWGMRRSLRTAAVDLTVLRGRRATSGELVAAQRALGAVTTLSGVVAVAAPLVGSAGRGHLVAAVAAVAGCVVALLGRDLWWAAADHQRRRGPRLRGSEEGSGAVVDLSATGLRLRGDGVAVGGRFGVSMAVGPAGERRAFGAVVTRVDPPEPAEPVGAVACRLDGDEQDLDDLAAYVVEAAVAGASPLGHPAWTPDPLLRFAGR